MKITKTMRILAVLLVSVMVFSMFAACTDELVDGETTAPQGNETTESANETTAPKGEETTAPKGDDTTAPADDDTTEPGDETTEPKVETTEPKVETTESEPETTESKTETTESEPETTESKTETTESKTETTETESETTEPECKHENAALDASCNLVCPDCKVTLDTDQHIAGAPDKDDACNVKCTNCGKLMESNKHTAGEADANDHCNIKCTVCNAVLEENKHNKKGATADSEDHCNIKCTVCGDVLVSNKHSEAVVDTADGCKVKCPVCNDVVEDAPKHNLEGVNWTPVLVSEGGSTKLQEEKVCTACNQSAEIRDAAAKVATDNIYINGGFVKKAEFTAEHAKSVVTNFGLGGWTAINGGVSKYVYRVNGGEWQDALWSGSLWNLTTSDAHVKAVTDSKLGLVDYGEKGGYNSGIYTASLQEYANQDITVEFGVVPKNNPGTAESINVIIIYTRDDLHVVCDHSANTNGFEYNAEDPQNLYCAECSVCGQSCKVEAAVTDKGLLVFGPQYLVKETASGLKPTLVTTEGGMSYIRVTATKASGEETDHIFSNTTNPIDSSKFKYVAVLYRCSSLQQLQVVYDGVNSGVKANVRDMAYAMGGDNWTFSIQSINTFGKADATGSGYYNGTQMTAFRVDYFNNARSVGTTADVAFIAFFETEADAFAYYALYREAYDVECGHYRVNTVENGTPEWKASETKPGYFAQYCIDCQAEVNFSACQHHDVSQLTNITAKDGATGLLTYTADCGLCGLKGIDVPAASDTKIFSAGELFAIGKNQTGFMGNTRAEGLVAEDSNANGMPYLKVIPDHVYTHTALGETYIILNDGTTDLIPAKYFAILYRTTSNTHFEIFLGAAGTTAPGNHSNKNIDGLIEDGEWHIKVVDVSTMAKYSENGVGWTRLDIFNPGSNGQVAIQRNVDIAYAGFFASAEDAEAYYLAYVGEYLGQDGCEHKFGDWVKNEETKELSRTCLRCDKVETKRCDEHVFDDTKWEKTEEECVIKNVCTFCEETVTITCEHNGALVCEKTAGELTFKFVCAYCGVDTGRNSENVIVLTPEQLIGMLDSAANANDGGANKKVAKFENTTDAIYNNIPYIRAEMITATNGESYVYITFPNALTGVGKYVSFGYRSYDINACEMFISATGGFAAGQNKRIDNISSTNYWSVRTFDFSAHTTFNATDGIKKIRWDIDASAKVGNYLDVAYLGFFNSQAEADAFYAAYYAEYGLDYKFNAHFDSCTVNGEKYSGPGSSGLSATFEYDLSGYTFDAAPEIKLHGWVLSSLGVESFQYRYIVEGEEPVLGATFAGANRPDVGTSDYAKALGFTEESGSGAGIDEKVIPIEGYEGKTVTVEIIAKCKDGKEIVAVSFQNITIPAAN